MRPKENEEASNHSVLRWLEEPEGERLSHQMANHLVRKYHLSSVTGDDLYNLAMTRLFHYFPQGPSPEIASPRAYLFRVIMNVARGVFAEEQKHSRVPLEDVPDEKLSDHFKNAQAIESRILFREVLNALTVQERELFTLMLNGFGTSRELAVKLNISHVTAAHRVAKLKEKIRKTILW
jgi:RNA polymerase sigma factor (sigma-70 family)